MAVFDDIRSKYVLVEAETGKYLEDGVQASSDLFSAMLFDNYTLAKRFEEESVDLFALSVEQALTYNLWKAYHFKEEFEILDFSLSCEPNIFFLDEPNTIVVSGLRYRSLVGLEFRFFFRHEKFGMVFCMVKSLEALDFFVECVEKNLPLYPLVDFYDCVFSGGDRVFLASDFSMQLPDFLFLSFLEKVRKFVNDKRDEIYYLLTVCHPYLFKRGL